MTMTMTPSIISHDGNDWVIPFCVKLAGEYEPSIFTDKKKKNGLKYPEG